MIYLVIWSHFIADFIFQSDKMAKNKSSSNQWLSIHIVTYMAVLYLLMVDRYSLFYNHNDHNLHTYVLINGLAHFCTDYVTSRITKKLWAEQKVHDFFVVIGLDQAIHLTTLVVTLGLLK